VEEDERSTSAHTNAHAYFCNLINNTVRCTSRGPIDRVSRLIINLSSHAASAKWFNAGSIVRDAPLAKIRSLSVKNLQDGGARTDSALKGTDRVIADFLGTVCLRPSVRGASCPKLVPSGSWDFHGLVSLRMFASANPVSAFHSGHRCVNVRRSTTTRALLYFDCHRTREIRKNRREHDNLRFVAFREVEMIKRCLRQHQRRVRSDRYPRIVTFADIHVYVYIYIYIYIYTYIYILARLTVSHARADFVCEWRTWALLSVIWRKTPGIRRNNGALLFPAHQTRLSKNSRNWEASDIMGARII